MQALQNKDSSYRNSFLDLVRKKANFDAEQHLKGPIISGYIQELCHTPFYVSLYTDKQLLIFRRLLSLDSAHCLFLDNCMTLDCISHSEKGKTRYYALVTKFPGEESVRTIPLLEFICNDHSESIIKTVLYHFFAKYANPNEFRKKLKLQN